LIPKSLGILDQRRHYPSRYVPMRGRNHRMQVDDMYQTKLNKRQIDWIQHILNQTETGTLDSISYKPK